jgi:plasmid replication initiation protein
MSNPLAGSERARLDAFVALADDGISPRDQRDLMSHPFFSLAKGRRAAPILYEAGGIRVEVRGFPEHGIATIWDADVLIWAASQIVEAADQGLRTSRFFRFRPYQLLLAIGRGPGQSQYVRLKQALQRLQSTVVLTTIRHGINWRRMQFSWINEWEELVDARGQSHGVELVLPEWFYRGVLDRSLVLTIDPAASSDGSIGWRAVTPVISRKAGRSNSDISTRSRGVRRGSLISRLIFGASQRVRVCLATTCLSNWTARGSCCGSSRAGYPQALWTAPWKLSADQAHTLSADQAHTLSADRAQHYLPVRRTNRS